MSNLSSNERGGVRFSAVFAGASSTPQSPKREPVKKERIYSNIEIVQKEGIYCNIDNLSVVENKQWSGARYSCYSAASLDPQFLQYCQSFVNETSDKRDTPHNMGGEWD